MATERLPRGLVVTERGLFLMSPPRPGKSMDITRGSLDEISRPAGSSRNHGSRLLSGSLEILTPEPSLTKVDSYSKNTEDDSQEHNDENGEKCGTQKMKTIEDIFKQKNNYSDFQLQIQSTNQVQECITSPLDSEDDCAEDEPGCSVIIQNQLAKIHAVSSAKLEDSKEKDVDPLLQKAIKKMKRLDQILATKQSHEKAIKKQGREMKRKLWEEFQSMSSRSSSANTEEVENTSRFLALTSSLQETLGPPAVEEDEMCLSVFQTQIYPESYDGSRSLAKQDCLNEERTKSSINKIENTHQKWETSCKKTASFIKKNIELAKDSGNQIVMLDEEKKRLSELLKDTEDVNSELQIIEKDATGWLVPGEGYTPEPMEYHHLAEIDAKLKLINSDGDLSKIQNSCFTVHQQIYQASLAYANRKMETVPGDKVLRNTKEERDQKNRLKEIDQQLKNLEETPNVHPRLSEQQLKALLEECMQSLRTANRLLAPPSFQGFLLPSCDTFENTILDTGSEQLHDTHSVRMLTTQEMVGVNGEDTSNDIMGTADCHLNKTLVESQLTEKPTTGMKLNDNPRGQDETACFHSSSEDFFMSMALNRDRLKKPDFLDEPFYCMNLNNEPSTDVDIPSIPLQTRGDALIEEDVSEE